MTFYSKVPLRIALAGGGTDHPDFVRQHGGFAITAAISQYVGCIVKPTWGDGVVFKGSHSEQASAGEFINHPLVRTAAVFYDVPGRTEILSLADIPGGTGLGSSGAFTVALCAAFSRYVGWTLDQITIARHAALIELEILKRGGGPQDHYACSLGDLQALHFNTDGSVTAEHPNISSGTVANLESMLHMYYVGWGRDADRILTTQSTDGLAEIKEYGIQALKVLESGDLDSYGSLLNDHWQAKKLRSATISTPQIDEYYETGLEAGALGGKLIGAGGGGFLLFMCDDGSQLDQAMASKGLRKVPFAFDSLGATVCRL